MFDKGHVQIQAGYRVRHANGQHWGQYGQARIEAKHSSCWCFSLAQVGSRVKTNLGALMNKLSILWLAVLVQTCSSLALVHNGQKLGLLLEQHL